MCEINLVLPEKEKKKKHSYDDDDVRLKCNTNSIKFAYKIKCFFIWNTGWNTGSLYEGVLKTFQYDTLHKITNLKGHLG